ncbi:uncharacterized protein LOC143282931 [Babylonia areolata]|uniref:uncharacterized protein LOC143282931 n=1 Tax=Babylonia areolata TaxID=304850 RepID=UPI003FD2C984
MDYFEEHLHEAIVTGDASSVEDYLKRGLSPDHAFRSTDSESSAAARLGKTLVEEAAQAGQAEVVRVLARHGCNPNLKYIVHVDGFVKPYTKQDRLKLSCLYPCVVKRQVAMVKELVQAGMDVNIHDDRGCTALWHAVDLQDYDMAKAMTSSPGCDVNIADVTMLRPLHVAALHGHVRLASLLVRHGAEVDAVQVRGSTALTLACKAGCARTARLLLLNGADPNHVGNNGHMPLSAALESCRDPALPELLMEAGAIVDCSTLRKCRSEKPPLLRSFPEMLPRLTEMARTPHALRLQCVLSIRRALLRSAGGGVRRLHFVLKVQRLPVPRIVQEFVLFGHL